MWVSKWKHTCWWGEVRSQETASERSPLLTDEMRPVCPFCASLYQLGTYSEIKDQVGVRRKPRVRRRGFNAEQMSLFK